MNKFTIGCDPELFLIDGAGKYQSSIGLIGGTKEVPADIGAGCAVQEDNVAVEFNIPPADSFEKFKQSIDYGMKYLEERAAAMNMRLAVHASAEFTPDQLKHPLALVFGCDPDFNAWTLKKNPRPHAPSQALRSCGGHIHVGTDLESIHLVRAMDLFLGCPSTILDKDTKRRQLYGKAGCYRKKTYGIEYRTLSNFWIGSEELIKWVYDQTERAIAYVSDKGKEITWPGALSGKIQSCINNNDRDAYMLLDEEFNFGV